MSSNNKALINDYLVTSIAPVALKTFPGIIDKIIIHSRGDVFISLGQDANSSNYTVKLNKNAHWELNGWMGSVSAIAESDPVYVDITEIP